MNSIICFIFLVFNVIALFPCQSGCHTCDNTTTICLQCQDPYPFMVSDGSCTGIDPLDQIPYCSIYSSNDLFLCDTCMITYQNFMGFCLYDDSGCIDYDQNGNCTFCGYNLILNNDGFCVGTFNCLNYSSNSGEVSACLFCQPGFTLVRNICKMNTGCFVYSSNGGCYQCKSGYVQSGFNCVAEELLAPTFIKPIQKQKCLLFDPLGNCKICKNGYVINNAYSCNFQNSGETKLMMRVASNYYNSFSVNPDYY